MSYRSRAATAVAALLAITSALAGIALWADRPGRFSHANYERITKGMELSQVEALLGAPGEEIPFDCIPGVPQYVKFPDAPDGWRGVVWGERCYRWRSGDDAIFIGVTGNEVVSKYHWELSF